MSNLQHNVGCENDTWLKDHIVNIFRYQAHNIRHYRIIYSFIPGKCIREWTADDAATSGHLFVLETLYDAEHHCSSVLSADVAARRGYISIIQYLHAHNIYCTSDGANGAARNGHLNIVHLWGKSNKPRRVG